MFHYSLFCEKTFNLRYSVPLVFLPFEILQHQKRMTLQNLMQNIEQRAILIQQEILRSLTFLTLRNFETQVCQSYGVKRIKF